MESSIVMTEILIKFFANLDFFFSFFLCKMHKSFGAIYNISEINENFPIRLEIAHSILNFFSTNKLLKEIWCKSVIPGVQKVQKIKKFIKTN